MIGGAAAGHVMDQPLPLDFDRDGAVLHRRAVTHCLADLLDALAGYPSDRAGVRLTGASRLQPLLEVHGAIGRLAAGILGPSVKAVRAILFDKSAETNWALGWHQDRTICVVERSDVEGFGPWTVKSGLIHVEPPFDLLARMVTLRVHLDDVGPDNAPLLIAPGSQHLGRIGESAIAATVGQCGVHCCLAVAGDAWLYATPILHASERARAPTHRRVLQVDFSADPLPGGLTWLGV